MGDFLYARKFLWPGRCWKVVVRASTAAMVIRYLLVFLCVSCDFCGACNFFDGGDDPTNRQPAYNIVS